MEVEKTGVSPNGMYMYSYIPFRILNVIAPPKKKAWFNWGKKGNHPIGQPTRNFRDFFHQWIQGQGTWPSEEPANAKNFMTNLRESVMISLMIFE